MLGNFGERRFGSWPVLSLKWLWYGQGGFASVRV